MQDQTVNIPVAIAVIWLINFAISIWNARVVGLMWAEADHYGGFVKFLNWCGAIMAFCGFFWCYAIIEAFVGNWLFPAKVTPDVMNGVFALGYIIIIFPVLGTGFAITASSIYSAWERRDFASVGTAAWNTFAQVHNTYEAFQGVPKAWDILGDLFGSHGSSRSSSSDSNGKGAAALIVVLIVAIAFILAFMTTAGIIMHYAGRRPLPNEQVAGGTRRTA
jgi:hypothetical protein